jgi:serine/threonine-protein kinase
MAPRLGELAVDEGYLSKEYLRSVLRTQVALLLEGTRCRLGSLLVFSGYLDEKELESLLALQKERGLLDYPAIPDYTVHERLGCGAKAQVYRATQLGVRREVALKILDPRDRPTEQDVTRFLRESRSAAKLSHPSIVQAIDCGQVGETYYLAMELVKGPSLQDVLNLYQRFSERRALQLARQIAEALRHIASQEMVHRDLKPQNVMLAGRLLKICDLGLAREIHPEGEELLDTRHGVIVGTPHYISPEQGRGRHDLDIRTDLYALGAILYRMVTGSLPFKGDTPKDFVDKHVNEPLTPPEDLCPTLSEETSELIQTLMAKNRRDRHQSAEAALEAIDGALEGLKESETLSGEKNDAENDGTGVLKDVEVKVRGLDEVSLRPVLFLTQGDELSRRMALDSDRLVVGRKTTCDVRVRPAWFSREHFVLRRHAGRWVLDDLGSRNGTRVNGMKVIRCVLQPGDEISVKGTRFVFLLEPTDRK